MIRRWLVGARGLALVWLVGAAPSLAQEVETRGPKPENVVVTLTNEEFGSQLWVEARVARLPDGTKVHVTLTEASTGGQAAFFATALAKQAFGVRKVFKNKTLAPLTYGVQVEVKLKAQSPAVGEYIRREFGLPRGANAILIRQSVTIGSPEMRAAFRLNAVKRLLGLARAARALHERLTTQVDVALPEDAERRKALTLDLYGELERSVSKPLNALTAEVLIHPERNAINDLVRARMNLGRVISEYHKGRVPEAKRRLVLAGAPLDQVIEELESRLAKESAGGAPASSPAPPTVTVSSPTLGTPAPSPAPALPDPTGPEPEAARKTRAKSLEAPVSKQADSAQEPAADQGTPLYLWLTPLILGVLVAAVLVRVRLRSGEGAP